MNLNGIKLFSFFSGAGFLDFGFEKTGFDIVYVNEYYKPFLEAYKYSRTKMGLHEPHYGYFNGDIADLLNENGLSSMVSKAKKQSDITGFIGGPPCPDFSVGGKNRGKEGDNGKLSAVYTSLICKERPDFFLFENVKGLWKTKLHKEFFNELKAKFHANGYITTEKLINTLEFSVPQERERIILLGFHKDFLNSNKFKLKKTQKELDFFPWDKERVYSIDKISSMPWPGTEPFKEDSIKTCPPWLPIELTVEYWFKKNDVYSHPNACDFFKPREGLKKMLVIEEGDDSKKSYKRLHRWRYSPTVAYGNNEVHLHPYKARRLSASESLSLQSLPKEFHLPPEMTLTDKFKTIGNGVPYLAAEALAKTISYFLEVIICH